MHHQFFDWMSNPLLRGQRLVIAAPRGYAKTTLFVLVKIIHTIVYQSEQYIVIVCQNNSEARERVGQIANELQHNSFIQAVFGRLLKPRTGGYRQQFVTETGIKVEAISVDMQFRGKKHGSHRPTLIVLDDVEKLSNTYNPEQREKLYQWFTKDVMKAVETNGTTNITIIGTVLHLDGLLAKLLNNAEWERHRFQAIISEATHQNLWTKWRSFLTDLNDPNHRETADGYYEEHKTDLLKGSQVLWPEVESYKSLMEMRVFGGEGAFRSEKQNDPYDPERQLFDMEQAETFTVEGSHLHFKGQTIPIASLAIKAFHDPCLGNDPNRLVGDYGAIAVVGQAKNNQLFVLDCYLKKSPPDEQIAAAYHLQQQWGFSDILVESNGFQKLLLPLYDDFGQSNHQKKLSIREVDQRRPKRERIATLQPLVANGHLAFNTALPQELINQFRLYPTDHDDGPDAIQGAVASFEQHIPRTTTLASNPQHRRTIPNSSRTNATRVNPRTRMNKGR